MAPKKKGSKKQQDDWEAELGETIPAATTPDAAADENDNDANDNKNEEDGMSGGLLAALKKNRSKKAKRGKGADNDFVEGEDPITDAAAAVVDDESKQPQEASFEGDEDDVFSGNAATRQRAKEKAAAMKEKAKEAAEEEGGRVKSKKEKEKEKKEREKQRKKEQVGFFRPLFFLSFFKFLCFGIMMMVANWDDFFCWCKI